MRNERVEFYKQLAEEQHAAAMTGGVAWRNFVARAERDAQMPWSFLRETLGPFCQAFYENLDVSNQDKRA